MELNPDTSLIDPFGVQFDLVKGIMHGTEDSVVRRASSMRGYYADEDALEHLIEMENDPIHYETFETPVPEQHGHVRFCISKLYGGVIGDEHFMTKGHYHTKIETGEIYLSLQGEGLMMMKLTDGTCRWEEFVPGRLVYAPPYRAHCSINTGTEPLISLCIYPGDAGHNYGDIQKSGFPKRVFRRSGQLVIE